MWQRLRQSEIGQDLQLSSNFNLPSNAAAKQPHAQLQRGRAQVANSNRGEQNQAGTRECLRAVNLRRSWRLCRWSRALQSSMRTSEVEHAHASRRGR